MALMKEYHQLMNEIEWFATEGESDCGEVPDEVMTGNPMKDACMDVSRKAPAHQYSLLNLLL